MVQLFETRRVQAPASEFGAVHGITVGPEEHRSQNPFEVRHEGTYPLPTVFTIGSNLKDPPASSLTHQVIAVWQAFATADVPAAEPEHHLGIVLPNDLICPHVDTKDTGVRSGGMVGSVIKYEHVPLWGHGSVMLVADDVSTPFPKDGSFGPFDKHQYTDFPETEENSAIRRGRDGVAMCPFKGKLQGTHEIGLYIAVLPRMP